jgi:UDP-N-acetylmuramoyl-tripeptide--D-alanyl-D-alanine ligase
MRIEELYEKYLLSGTVSTDTRNISENCVFFALKGENFNGNEFAQTALDNGASFAVIDEAKHQLSEQYILVDDVLKTLQELAKYHRNQLDIPFIGITGTNGKTTTKEFINTVLSQKFNTVCTKGNLNNHIGVPLTLLSIDNSCEMAIIEMGANHVGEIAFLCNIAQPDYGIITNIGTAHVEGFGSAENIKKTKNELYEHIASVKGKVFVNNQDEILMDLSQNIDRLSYGDDKSDCSATLLSSIPYVKIKWNEHIIESQLYGKYNFDNILAAICIGNYFKVDSKKIKTAIASYTPTNNRSQIIQIDGNTIFLDAYNANPTSMNAAIDTFSENEHSNKLMVLGDMLELGDISKTEHQNIVDKANKLAINALFVGQEFGSVSRKYGFVFLKDVSMAIDWIKQTGLLNHQILIKGSRGIRLEGIAEYLQKKGS